MNGLIETLNAWGENFLNFAWPMLLQSGALIAVVFALEFFLARKVRAAVRHALWLVVLAKLLLPPALALPTGPAWWLWRPAPLLPEAPKNYTVTYGPAVPLIISMPQPAPTPKPPKLTVAAGAMIVSAAGSMALLLWLALGWLRLVAKIRRAASSENFSKMLEEVRQLAGLRCRIRLKLVDDRQSPAVCGLIRPVILLPRALARQLSARQLHAVLLHEAVHLRRGDVWINCAQTLLQIVYWWHPLLWLANARIRNVREEAVDDAVMLALDDSAESYAPTLLEVAKFAFRRPWAGLGLIGILESRSALRRRVERLIACRPPRTPGLTFLSVCGIFAFSAVALPMGQGPVSNAVPPSLKPTHTPRDGSLHADPAYVHIKARFFEVPKEFFADAKNSLPSDVINGTNILTATESTTFLRQLESQPGTEELAEPEATTDPGRQVEMRATVTTTIITNYAFAESSTNSIISPQFSHVETGPILDVVSDVLPDGHTLELQTIASRIKWLGYAAPAGLPIKYATNAIGDKIGLPVSVPVFRIDQASNHVLMNDGQTLVLFPKARDVSSGDPAKDKRIREHIQSAEERSGQKVLIALVTVTRVDAAGKPLNLSSLTPEQAASMARQLANDRASRIYGSQPFQDGQPARLQDGRWVWNEHVGYGYHATVQLAEDGSTNWTDVQLWDDRIALPLIILHVNGSRGAAPLP
jgi:beta-lactamase regulating signal transducer with metallopeptidase domain